MKMLFIIDPIEKLKAYKDSSVAMMRAAQSRGHSVFTATADSLVSSVGVSAQVAKITTSDDDHAWYTPGLNERKPLKEFDAVLMRKDPPFDAEYLYNTHLLSQAEREGARVFNRAATLRDHNEKLAILEFPQFTAATIVTSDAQHLNVFIDEHQDTIFKRLDGMGGAMIFRVRADDPNRNVIIETMTGYGGQTIMAQRYIPAIKDGDKRVLLVNGKPAPFALARIPKAGETRGNLAAGGRGEARPITARDREIAEGVGLLLVGLDVIGDHLTEINVTSPTCMVEIKTQTGYDIAASVIEAIEAA
jgi:glutathione synthase